MQNKNIDKRKYSYDEYLKLEETEGMRYEYFNGEVFAMKGTSKTHYKIAKNISGILSFFFEQSSCETFQESIKLEIEKNNYYVYPDVIVSCDESDKKDIYFVRNPFIIVEVSSDSTINFDNSIKLHRYIKIPSLKYYLLISQKKSLIELYTRQNNTSLFIYSLHEGLYANINIVEDILKPNLMISLEEVYKSIKF